LNDSEASRDVVFHDSAYACIHKSIQCSQHTGCLPTDTSTPLYSTSLHYKPITSRDIMKKIHNFVACSLVL